jgi:hypothetical protein
MTDPKKVWLATFDVRPGEVLAVNAASFEDAIFTVEEASFQQHLAQEAEAKRQHIEREAAAAAATEAEFLAAEAERTKFWLPDLSGLPKRDWLLLGDSDE